MAILLFVGEKVAIVATGDNKLTERGESLLISALGTCRFLLLGLFGRGEWWSVRQLLHGVFKSDSGQSQINGLWHEAMMPQTENFFHPVFNFLISTLAMRRKTRLAFETFPKIWGNIFQFEPFFILRPANPAILCRTDTAFPISTLLNPFWHFYYCHPKSNRKGD